MAEQSTDEIVELLLECGIDSETVYKLKPEILNILEVLWETAGEYAMEFYESEPLHPDFY